MRPVKFTLSANDRQSKARAGIVHTDHGDGETPIFMPVGTAGTVKLFTSASLNKTSRRKLFLANTYHLYLRPGTGLLQQAGGLHKFNGWSKPILYRQWRLPGCIHFLKTGRSTMRVCSNRISMVRSMCSLPKMWWIFNAPSVRTLSWHWTNARLIHANTIMPRSRSRSRTSGFNGASGGSTLRNPCMGINKRKLLSDCSGSVYKISRIQSFGEFIAIRISRAIPLAVYRLASRMNWCMKWPMWFATFFLPTSRVTWWVSAHGEHSGVYCFGCGYVWLCDATRNARNGMLFTTQGIVNIRNEKWKDDLSPIDAELGGYASTFYSSIPSASDHQ